MSNNDDNTSNQLVIVSTSVINNTRDSYESKFQKIEHWINQIINQTEKESNIKKNRCEICNSKEEKSQLQLHHVAGRKFDYRMISVCLTCHRWLSDRQKIRDVRWWHHTNNNSLKAAFFFMGIYDILILKSEKTGNSIYKDLAYSYTETISKHQREAV